MICSLVAKQNRFLPKLCYLDSYFRRSPPNLLLSDTKAYCLSQHSYSNESHFSLLTELEFFMVDKCSGEILLAECFGVIRWVCCLILSH